MLFFFFFFEFVAPVSTAKLTLLRCDKSNGNSPLPSENVKHAETQQSHLKNFKKKKRTTNWQHRTCFSWETTCYLLRTNHNLYVIQSHTAKLVRTHKQKQHKLAEIKNDPYWRSIFCNYSLFEIIKLLPFNRKKVEFTQYYIAFNFMNIIIFGVKSVFHACSVRRAFTNQTF